jgi:hypothetical protein
MENGIEWPGFDGIVLCSMLLVLLTALLFG